MASSQCLSTLLVIVVSGVATAEELPELPTGCLSSGVDPQCYTAGDVTGAVLGTLLATLALLALGYAIYRMYWRGRRGKHLVLVADPERGVSDDYAFDNPCFRDGTPIGRGGYEKEPVKSDQKSRWSAWSPLEALVGNRTEKRRALDDSFTGEPQVNVVSLRSHDFTGLGFNVCGNMRDGIFVKDVLHRGPASESGRITSGDRIDSIRISFRHMVFEDALTILSYASPYEVQLEVENPLPSSRPSTLIRTKRSSIEPADRICHPFYRSQSIADLAQIGKSSLKRVPDMGEPKSPKSKNELWDESRGGDYPTLKLSPLPTKETVKLEKASAPLGPVVMTIVKPERAKKAPVIAPDSVASAASASAETKQDSPSKHQKFGIRVLPDSKALSQLKKTSDEVKTSSGPSTNPDNVNSNKESLASGDDKLVKKSNILEAERRENERNSMVEQTGGMLPTNKPVVVSSNVNVGKVVSPSVTVDIVDGARVLVNPLTYDERGIDVGPAEEEEENRRRASLGVEPGSKGEETTKRTSDGAESHNSNVKQLLSKGLQNLKDKLHHHDKKKTVTAPEPQVQGNPDDSKKSDLGKGMKKGKSIESLDIDVAKNKPEKIQVETSKSAHKNVEKEEQEKVPKKEVDKDSNEGKIPTEIPEEMHRAAMAARNNRRASGYIPPDTQVLTVSQDTAQNPREGQTSTQNILSDATDVSIYPPVKYRVRPQGSLSEDSSGDDLGAGTSGSNDSIGKAPKRSNKRKAPIPPLKDGEDGKDEEITRQPQRSELVSESVEVISKGGNPFQIVTTDSIVNVVMTQVNTNGSDHVQTMEVLTDTDKHSRFAEIPKQQNSPSSCNEITNIAVESVTSVQPSNPLLVQEKGPARSVADVSNELMITVDSPHSKKTNNPNSDSDSDDDNDAMLSLRKRNKKGGTTIELNSSHITIHHSPSSDIVTLELEGDSTRKAASMGDLSRLDTQPMSVLERAVSLDLADGNTPHGGKKRKAPLPPPGDEYLNAVQDSDDGGTYRKEPRLDNALDTFQRRRLKKSSDWGTMEDAMQQGSPPPSPRKSLASPTNILIGSYDNEPTSLTISIGDDDSEVFVESLPQQVISETGALKSSSHPVASVRTFDAAGRAYILPSTDVDAGYASISLRGMENVPDTSVNVSEGQGSKRTVLRITPEPSVDVITTSQVTLMQDPSSSSLSMGQVRGDIPDSDTEINGSRLLGILQGEHRNNVQSVDVEDVEPDTSVSAPFVTQSTEHHTIVSSTPIVRRDRTQFRQHVETVQSPQVTSSDVDSRNVNAVSSSTHIVESHSSDQEANVSSIDPNVSGISEINSTFEDDSNVSVTSTSEPFITATGIVDSTTFVGTSDDDDSTIGQDSQPPELPTSPMPVLTSTYNPSSSLTYITEIQVTTANPSKAKDTETEVHNGPTESRVEMVDSSVAKARSVSISPDSMGSDMDDSEMDAPTIDGSKVNGGYGQQRNNVTVTAIRNADRSRIPTRVGNEGMMTTFQSPGAMTVERSQIPLRVGTDTLLTTFASHSHVVTTEPTHIPMRMTSGGVLTTFQNNSSPVSAERSHIPTRIVSPGSQETSPVGNNGITEKKSKPVRPPVPPRKSDSSLSSSMSVEEAQSNSSVGSHTYSNHGSNSQSMGGAKKYISFSSLTPRPVSIEGSPRNSSFEQWVFLDDSQGHTTNGNAHNGQETTGSESVQHSSTVTLPVSLSNRPPSVTHIVLDSKMSSGKRSSP